MSYTAAVACGDGADARAHGDRQQARRSDLARVGQRAQSSHRRGATQSPIIAPSHYLRQHTSRGFRLHCAHSAQPIRFACSCGRSSDATAASSRSRRRFRSAGCDLMVALKQSTPATAAIAVQAGRAMRHCLWKCNSGEFVGQTRVAPYFALRCRSAFFGRGRSNRLNPLQLSQRPPIDWYS